MTRLILGGVTLGVIGYAFCEDGCDILPSKSSHKNSADDDENTTFGFPRNNVKLDIDRQFHTIKVGIYETTLTEFNTLLSQIKNTDFEKPTYDEPILKIAILSQYSDNDISEESWMMIEDLKKSLSDLDTLFETYNKKLGYIVAHSDDYSTYTETDKEIVKTALTLAKMIDKICHLVLFKDGEISKKSQKVLRKSKELLDKLNP